MIDGKSKEEKADILEAATKEARKDREKNKVRGHKLLEGIKRKLAESRILLEKRKLNKRENKEKTFEIMMQHGIWSNDEDIQTGVQHMSKTKALTVLKAQIRFRTDMLGCNPPRKFNFSKSTQQEHVDFLTELTRVEIPEDSKLICNIIEDPRAMVGFQFTQHWATDTTDNVCRGKIVNCEDVPGKELEFVCQFEDEADVTCQTVSEVLADMVVNDLYFYV